MSDKCDLCGLTAEHERRVCTLKDDSTHKLEFETNVPALTGTALAWIGEQVDAAQKANPGKWLEVTIRGIAPMPQRSSFIPMTHENKPTERHKSKVIRVGTSPSSGKVADWVFDGEGKGIGLDASSATGEQYLGGYSIEELQAIYDSNSDTWECSNHPPGSEVQVEKGKSCYCGMKEDV